MGYYMRFVSADKAKVSTEDLKKVLAGVSPSYRFEGADASGVVIHFGEHVIADVSLNIPGDGLFEDELEELIEEAEEARGWRKYFVLNTLRNAKQIIAVQVLFGDGDSETTLGHLDPLWNWLTRHRDGLCQADGEGYYRGSKLILRVE